MFVKSKLARGSVLMAVVVSAQLVSAHLFSEDAWAQNSNASPTSGATANPFDKLATDGVLNMSAAQFETFLLKQRNDFEIDQQGAAPPPPMPRLRGLEDFLLKRLQGQRETTDGTVMAVVGAWTSFESPIIGRPVQKDEKGHLFPETRRVLEQLMPFAEGRAGLQAKLHQRKAQLLRLDKQPEEAVKEFDAAIQILTKLQIDTDLQRENCIVDMGDTLLLAGDKKNAESAYLAALSYNWIAVRDADAMHRFKDLYLRAGRGLIDLRRGNLAKLKELFFWPSTLQELGPLLKEAIRQAGGN